MRVTTKGQVTIPQYVREKLGITPQAEVDFVGEGSRFYLEKIRISAKRRIGSQSCAALEL